MRSVSALDVRRKFGEIVDAAAGGERIVIERAGQPIAAIVPLADLALFDPDRRKAARLAAIDDIVRMARRRSPVTEKVDAAAAIRRQRDQREQQIADALRGHSGT
jgi:prevent-host-death family protein